MTFVLFVCTGNAARSQMAEGLLKSMKSDFTVLSAGTKPEGLHPNAVKAMAEIGLDISNLTSKGLDDVNWKDADFAIWSGHPLSTFSICEETWLDGKQFFSTPQDKYFRQRDNKLRNDLIQKILNTIKHH